MEKELLSLPQTLRPEQLTALLDAILAISGDLSLSETLKRIVRAASQLTGARYAALGVPDETGAYLAEFVTTGMSAEAEARIGHRPRGHGILGVILREGKTLRLRDLSEHPQSYGFPPHHPPMTSLLGTPVRYKGDTLGNLYLTDKQGALEFTEDDERLVEVLATHAGLAIQNARLYGQVQQLRVVEERQRIGMDLHDGIIQSIYAVGLTLEYVDGQLAESDVPGARDRLRVAIEALNATIRDIRAYILDLRPKRFEGSDLVAGLQGLLAEFRANTLIAVDFNAEPHADTGLWPEARMALFHIAQEALSNAAKHSRASRMSVRLGDEDGHVTLTLSDNGQGFDPARVEHRAGHGLMNMQDRARALGGRLTFECPPGQGTTVKVNLPRRQRGATQ
jgi:signal transduction histidine kinase